MLILADENVHTIVVVRIRAAGFRVEWIREDAPGTGDGQILERPDVAELIFITGDRDFSELIFAQSAPRPYCILYSRIPHPLANATADRLIELLKTGVPGQSLVTVTAAGNRARPYPGVTDG